jgi:transposase
VPRPDRRLRRQRGKSDPIDAEAAARAVLAGTATVKPKSIEAIRAIRVARNGAVKAKTAATNALQALLITAPEPLRAQLRCRSTIKLVETCGGLRPDMARLHDPTQAFKLALRVDQAGQVQRSGV